MKFWLLLSFVLNSVLMNAASLFLEAENFTNKGGWKVDQQFMDLMGSPYLLAHGLGVPVEDAYTEVVFPEKGDYYVYVRTYNWTSPWKQGEGPGKFAISVGGKRISRSLGTEGTSWMWQPAGKVSIKKTKTTVRLHDLTGFDGDVMSSILQQKRGKFLLLDWRSWKLSGERLWVCPWNLLWLELMIWWSWEPVLLV